MSEFHHEPKRVFGERPASTHRPPPPSWWAFRRSLKHRWLQPLLFIDWLSAWITFGLSRLSFPELLEYCGSFSILVGVIFYFADAPQRTKMRHYQAWQVLNTAEGKGGSGGRIDAMQELNMDGVSLVAVNGSGAYLEHIQLSGAELRRSTFDAADLLGAVLNNVNLSSSDLEMANLRDAELSNANLSDIYAKDADFTSADLQNADMSKAVLINAELCSANLANLRNWKQIKNLYMTNIHGVQNAPEGFVEWAKRQGAVDRPPIP